MRLKNPDWLVLGILMPIAVAVFSLHVRSVFDSGLPRLPFYGTPAANAWAYPTAAPHLEVPRAASQVERGDRLLRAGDVDLRGVGYTRFEAIVRAQAGSAGVLPFEIERDGVRRVVTVELAHAVAPWERIPFLFSFIAIALVVLLRAPGTRYSRLTFVALLCQAIARSPFDGSYGLVLASSVVSELMGGIAIGATLVWAVYFPPEVPNHRRPPLWIPLLLALAWPLSRLSRHLGGPLTIEQSQLARALVDVAWILALLAILTWNYRAADPVGRRRIKWLTVGVYAGTVAPLTAQLLNALSPEFVWFEPLMSAGYLLLVSIPLGLLVGIVRYNLFDIDRVISATASYSALGAAAAALVLGGLPRIASASSAALGLEPNTTQLVLGIAVVGLVLPLHRRLRPRLERIFFPERHTLEQGFGRLLEAIASARGAEELARCIGESLHRLLRPQSAAAYASSDESEPYEPVVVYGRAVPPRFERASPVIASLRASAKPLVFDGSAHASLGPAGAELERMGAAVIVPVRRSEGLPGFIYLGAKQSGDVYTATDLALLTALGSAASTKLLALDDVAIIDEARSMQDALRRYVPGAIADQLEAGAGLEPAEREVSAFFVDIRGYTSLSQDRRAEEVFSIINRYTRTVSEIVRARGGSIVEFAGDGLMALFGAPQELPEKERAAVLAAREVCRAVGGLSVEPGGGSAATTLSVGVGIATGLAFVGNIQAVDRMIWSAIGDTINLAARLEALTRDLDAEVVIDATTSARAGADVGGRDGGFAEHPETPIKGRRDTVTVYALPRSLDRERSAA